MAKKTAKRKTGASSVPAASASKRTKRYTDEQKEEILEFVRAYDKVHKRGGQAAAVKKFGVTALTISKWRKEARKSPKKKAVEVRIGKPRKPAETSQTDKPDRGDTADRPTNPEATLKRMLAIRREIDELRTEYASLKAAL
ncbi:MAG: hypothetical protein WD342_07070 [Verrucomicrobiales bacterium]